jgi:E3 ubiquitin-protein ligase HERC2
MDNDLVDAVSRHEEKTGLRSVPPKELCALFVTLKGAAEPLLKSRIQVLTVLADRFWKVLPFCNVLLAPGQSALTDLFLQARSLVFWATKKSRWQAMLTSTVVRSDCPFGTIQTNMFQASEMASRKKIDTALKLSLFGQVYQKLKTQDAVKFRLGVDARAFKVQMIGLNASDAGGPYRAVLDQMCTELQSPVLPLFVPSSNNSADAGEGRDQYVPMALPDQAPLRAARLAAYNFVGQLLGLAIRTQNLLPLNWPSIVWKHLVNDNVTLEDVKRWDLYAFKLLETCKSVDVPEYQFEVEMDDTYFDVLAMGTTLRLPLMHGGSCKPVTYANRREFHDLLLAYRLSEFKEQCAAIRQGLATVVPFPFLSLLSWSQLEYQVCGGAFDVDLLERNTQYEGYSSGDATIRMFWKMMRERFDDRTRSLFLKFVWGRYEWELIVAISFFVLFFLFFVTTHENHWLQQHNLAHSEKTHTHPHSLTHTYTHRHIHHKIN